MSLKHLFAGIMGGGFALALGSANPVPVVPEAAEVDEKPPERSTKDCAKDQVRVVDQSRENDKADKPASRQTTWAQRLVFPSGSKF